MRGIDVYTRLRMCEARPATPPRAILLEGDWPTHLAAPSRVSLDQLFDAKQAMLDSLASAYAERLSEQLEFAIDAYADAAPRETAARSAGEQAVARPPLSFASLNVLPLRYYLLKLLRVAVHFIERLPLRSRSSVRLYAEVDRDDDYVALFQSIARTTGCHLDVRWIDPIESMTQPPSWGATVRQSLEHVVRDGAGILNATIDAAIDVGGRLADQVRDRWRRRAAARPRVVFCGQPAVLDPISAVLAERGWQATWLWETFNLRQTLRWRRRGVRQVNVLPWHRRGDIPPSAASRLPPIHYRGVDLRGAVEVWLERRRLHAGPRQAAMLAALESHLARLRADVLVLDEDASPWQRAAIAIARRAGTRSLVIQHGIPGVRFGFAPLFADAIAAWGETSAVDLTNWGIDRSRIFLTGSPRHDDLIRQEAALHAVMQSDRRGAEVASTSPSVAARSANQPPRILVFAAPPPDDARPDALWYHATTSTYRRQWDELFAALARIGAATVVIKLHPRGSVPESIAAAAERWPRVNYQVVRQGDFSTLVRAADLVISCASSAGVEATLFGVPVIQLLPVGSGPILGDPAWGLAGAARTADELVAALAAALEAATHGDASADRRASKALRLRHVFSNLHHSAATAAADLIEHLAGERMAAKAKKPPATPALALDPAIVVNHGPALLRPGSARSRRSHAPTDARRA